MSRPTADRLTEIVAALPGARVTVFGDAILDEFEYGEIARVSREAPVLILQHRRSQLVPGGGANTAVNLAAIGARVDLVARVGADDRGTMLKALLRDAGVGVAGLLFDRSIDTPTKTRVLAGTAHTVKQQIVRIDRGRVDDPPSPAVRRRLVARGRKARERGDALILADYGYGAVDPPLTAEIGRGRGAVTLDSRFALDRYRGVDAATPNLEELEGACGSAIAENDDQAVTRAGSRVRRKIGAEALLVTRGPRGMTLIEEKRPARHVPVFGSDEVADVTGAGDTVIATFTAARATGASWLECAELANVAGGLVVMKRGTATVSADELIQAIEADWSSEEGES